MWISLLDRMLVKIFKTGDLHVTMPDGTTHTYGDGTEPTVRIQLIPNDLPKRLLNSPELVTGEAYMDGELVIEDDDIYGFTTLALRNLNGMRAPIWWQKLAPGAQRIVRRMQQHNPIAKAQLNVSHHYDLSGQLYDLFLDKDKQYSCGYFRDPGNSLEQAQIDKKNHIARKLLIEPGMKVLDIGCGWGGMGLTLAKDYGAQVVGVTLSIEQHRLAQMRAEENGLADHVDFRLIDYRQIDEKFDRIVSVGMFEHVGAPHYAEYFEKIDNLLLSDGVALIHTIGQNGSATATSPWIQKYIFPGGAAPSMSEVTTAIETTRISICDIEIWHDHYADTLDRWFDAFSANREKVLKVYDERFFRMWCFYLQTMAASFRIGNQVVFQFQLAKSFSSVPNARDYLYPNSDMDAKSATRSRTSY